MIKTVGSCKCYFCFDGYCCQLWTLNCIYNALSYHFQKDFILLINCTTTWVKDIRLYYCILVTHFQKTTTNNKPYNIIFRPFSFSSANINFCFSWSLSFSVSFSNPLKWSLYFSASLNKLNSKSLFSSEFRSLSNIWNLVTP